MSIHFTFKWLSKFFKVQNTPTNLNKNHHSVSNHTPNFNNVALKHEQKSQGPGTQIGEIATLIFNPLLKCNTSSIRWHCVPDSQKKPQILPTLSAVDLKTPKTHNCDSYQSASPDRLALCQKQQVPRYWPQSNAGPGPRLPCRSRTSDHNSFAHQNTKVVSLCVVLKYALLPETWNCPRVKMSSQLMNSNKMIGKGGWPHQKDQPRGQRLELWTLDSSQASRERKYQVFNQRRWHMSHQ